MCSLLIMMPVVLAGAGSAAKDDPDSVVLELRDFTKEIQRKGTFIPAEFEEISLWLEEYASELLLLDVLPHGTPVNDGDVIARIDLRSIDRQVEAAERAVRSAELALKNAVERAAIDRSSSKAALDDSRAELELARRELEGWEKYELVFNRRNAKLTELFRKHGIEDQEDELAQLESMYRDDELVDATEEIVLKRARRDLARSRTSLKNQADWQEYNESYTEASRTERKRRGVKSREKALDRLLRSREIEERSRAAGLEKTEVALREQIERLERLERDREKLIIRAPRAGFLLHGSPDDYRPGRVSPRYKRGGRAATRTTLFTVAMPDRLGVALDVPESRLKEVRAGMGVKVVPAVCPETTLHGRLHLDRFPSPQSAAAGENSYKARAELELPATGLVPGMRAEVNLVVESLHDVFVLPKSMVHGEGDEAHCWSLVPGSEKRRRVSLRLGPCNDAEVVVYGDLSEKMKVMPCGPQQ